MIVISDEDEERNKAVKTNANSVPIVYKIKPVPSA